MEGRWPRRLTTVLVCLSLFLQLGAIFSPGWMVKVRGDYEEYDSVFYKTKCSSVEETRCETETFLEIYDEARSLTERAGLARVRLAEIDYAYHKLVLKQVLVIVSLAMTLLLLLAQILRTCHETRKYHRLITRMAVVGTIPTGLMIGIICHEFVYIAYMIELESFDGHRDNTYIGFPYSLALYIGGLTFLFLAITVLTCQSAGPGKPKEEPTKKTYYSDDFDEDRPTVKAEFVPVREKMSIATIETPTQKPTVESNNTVCYSEKL